MDCTEAYAEAKAQGRSFFLYYLYAILRAANEIKEFRYRWDKHGQVVYHDTVDITTPIAVPGKTFYTVRIPWNNDFKAFYEEARRIITSIPEDGDPYGTDKEIAAQGDFDVILLSATPKLYFTSISYTQYAPGHPLDYPLMNAGKAVTREGRLVHAHCTDRKPRLCRRGAHLTVLREGREVPEGKINKHFINMRKTQGSVLCFPRQNPTFSIRETYSSGLENIRIPHRKPKTYKHTLISIQ